MAVADREEQARGSFAHRMWGDAFERLWAAHCEGQLDVEDLERLAVSAYMVGRDGACEEAWIAAHHAWLRRGEAERAAGCAFWQALGFPGSGTCWFELTCNGLLAHPLDQTFPFVLLPLSRS